MVEWEPMTDFKERVGEAIRRLRVERGLSQALLADLAGIPQQTISAAERGERMPRIDTFLSLSEALGVTPDTIFEEAGLFPSDGGRRESEMSFWELWGIMKRMPEDEREEIIRYALYRERGSRK